MKKKLSYRDKLLELAYIYNVKEIQEYTKRRKNLTTGQIELILKKELSDLLISEITPVGKEIKKLLDDKAHLEQILKKGKEKANIIAEENLKNIREKVGLI